MRAVARQAIQSAVRANRPLGASLQQHSGGVGLRTSDIDAWLANIFNSQPGHFDQMRQYEGSAIVYRAIKMRADAVARAPLKAHRVKRTGELEWVGTNHPVQQHLDRVNPWWTHADMWRGVETYLSLWGQAFRYIDRSASSVAEWEQWLLRPDKVVIVKDKADYIKGFIYDPHGANFPILPDEMIWDRYFDPLDEFGGLSPLAPLQEVLEMRSEMITTNRNLFKNGALVQNLAFLFKTELTQVAVDDFYRRVDERHAGSENANRPFVADRDTDVKNLGLSNREMEWMAGLRWTKDDVMTALGIPEEMLPGAERTTFANRAEARRDFFQHTIASEWELLETQMQERFVPILPPEHNGLVLKFDTTIVEGMQETVDAKAARLRADLTSGAITPDEYRAEFGRTPMPDGIGSMPYVPSGTTPLSIIAGGEVEAETEEPKSLPAPADDVAEDEPVVEPEAEAVPEVLPSGDPIVDIQQLALNGAQVTALLEIIQMVTDKLLSPDTAKPLIAASFPSLTEKQINDMVDTAAGFDPKPVEDPATPTGPEPEDERMIAEVRCPDRGHLTGRNVIEGSGQYCRKCKVEFKTEHGIEVVNAQ